MSVSELVIAELNGTKRRILQRNGGTARSQQILWFPWAPFEQGFLGVFDFKRFHGKGRCLMQFDVRNFSASCRIFVV